MRKLTAITLIIITLLLLAACAPGESPSGKPLAWIDTPLDGSTLPLASVEVMSHAADPGGIARFVLSVNGEVVSSAGSTSSGSLATMRQTWDPPAPGLYILEVRAVNNAGVWSDYAQVLVTIAGTPAAPEDLPVLPTAITPTPTLELSPTPLPLPSFVLSINAYCRFGPGEIYGILATILAGEEVPIIGVNQANTWWYLRMTDGTRCWASMLTGSPRGRYHEVPVVLDPATPTQVPPTPQGQQGCYVLNAQQQKVCTVPCPPNTDPVEACTP